MYTYPSKPDLFKELIRTNSKQHSMGESLKTYLELKIHPYLSLCNYDRIRVVGKFDRTAGVSANEKDKTFNWIRPTAVKKGNNTLELRCFPGKDYVYHYANIVNVYMSQYLDYNATIYYNIPSEMECWEAIEKSELKNLPSVKTVIMGYVEGLAFLSKDKEWIDCGMYQYNYISDDAILLGCKHTYWGDIAGRIVTYLSSRGTQQVIYAGKLGTLNESIVPNTCIATGNKSILPNGKSVTWENLFSPNSHSSIIEGVHITLPSVLQETKEWVECNKLRAQYVDPEIGHMAYAAKQNRIRFSYLHIISDNISAKYSEDLSNERILEVIEKRKGLLHIIGNCIREVM